MEDNHQIKNLLTIINNKTYNNTPIMNGTSNNSFLNDRNNNFIKNLKKLNETKFNLLS